MYDIILSCYLRHGRRLALAWRVLPSHSNERRAMLMDVFQFMQIAGFALAFFMAGYNFGKKK